MAMLSAKGISGASHHVALDDMNHTLAPFSQLTDSERVGYGPLAAKEVSTATL